MIVPSSFVEQFREIFFMFAHGEEGTITTKELGTIMRALGQSPIEAELQDIINEVSQEGGNTLDFEEFLTLMTRRMKGADVEAELSQVFESFDQDGDQIISPQELKSAMQHLGETLTDQEVQEMVRESDGGSGDGRITLQRFLSLMANK